MKDNKAAEVDDPTELLKGEFKATPIVMHNMFQDAWRTNTIPLEKIWNYYKTFPKKGDKTIQQLAWNHNFTIIKQSSPGHSNTKR